MPNLPTFDITDAVTLKRVMDAFDMDPNLTPQQEFKQWLKRALIEEVQRREAVKVTIAAGQQIEQARQESSALLDSGIKT